MIWVLVWVLLVLAAVAVLGLLAWGLVRRVIALGAELGRSAERVGPVLEQVRDPYRPASSVLSDPTTSAQDPTSQAEHRRTPAEHRRFPAGRGDRAQGRVG